MGIMKSYAENIASSYGQSAEFTGYQMAVWLKKHAGFCYKYFV